MELNRQLQVGDRVRVLPEAEIRSILRANLTMPEANGHSLSFAHDMFRFCGAECVVTKIYENYRVLLERVEDGKYIGWIWCPSMLEDVEDDFAEAPDPSGLFAWLVS